MWSETVDFNRNIIELIRNFIDTTLVLSTYTAHSKANQNHIFTHEELIWRFVGSWWRHQMEAIFASLALCVGNSPVTGEFPAQRPVRRSIGVFFDLHLNKRFSKHSWGWWVETLFHSLWRHCNDPFGGLLYGMGRSHNGVHAYNVTLTVSGW